MSNREDSVLDEIDRLVDESLARGDRSDSFHGEQYRAQQPCPWCVEGYHYLPITQEMWRMRQGSYAQDEFGIGIVDPDYRFEDDESPILCPGSEFHGPPYYFNGLKLWDKQSRERAAQGALGSRTPTFTPDPPPTLPPGRIRRLRFYGPFSRWTVSLDDERIIEDIVPGPNIHNIPGWPDDPYRPRPVVREHRLTASFEAELPIKDPTREWLERNIQDVVDQEIRMTPEGTFVTMKPIVFPFRQFTVHASDPQAAEPDWVEFETTYQIERHPWFMEFWSVAGSIDELHLRPVGYRQGLESDYAIIDEAYQFDNERLRQHVEEAQSRGSRPPSQEATDEAERRQAVLRGGQEAASSSD
ncbi:hypothetical protein SEA_NOSHOW_66 [Mycobacterium phage NoShow]|nr:hypothetical protein SEA_NOSHOW_66 [Mycobacterium phage NoShow]